MFKKIKNQRGFTLVELLVSTSIFVIVIMIAVSAFVAVSASAKNSRALRRVMDNLAFAMEHTSRTVSYGKDFSCVSTGAPGSCPFSSGATTSSGTDTLYLNGNYAGGFHNIIFQRQINPVTGRGYIARNIDNQGYIPITDPMLDIENLTFFTHHTEPYSIDPHQPYIIVIISGTAYATSDPQSFSLQSVISMRELKL